MRGAWCCAWPGAQSNWKNGSRRSGCCHCGAEEKRSDRPDLPSSREPRAEVAERYAWELSANDLPSSPTLISAETKRSRRSQWPLNSHLHSYTPVSKASFILIDGLGAKDKALDWLDEGGTIVCVIKMLGGP